MIDVIPKMTISKNGGTLKSSRLRPLKSIETRSSTGIEQEPIYRRYLPYIRPFKLRPQFPSGYASDGLNNGTFPYVSVAPLWVPGTWPKSKLLRSPQHLARANARMC